MAKSSKAEVRRLKTALRWKIPAAQRQRIQMVLLRESGMAQPAIAAAMGVSLSTVNRKRCCDHTSAVGSSGRHRSGDQAARRTLVCSAQAHGSNSSSFWAGQPLTSLARMSAR